MVAETVSGFGGGLLPAWTLVPVPASRRLRVAAGLDGRPALDGKRTARGRTRHRPGQGPPTTSVPQGQQRRRGGVMDTTPPPELPAFLDRYAQGPCRRRPGGHRRLLRPPRPGGGGRRRHPGLRAGPRSRPPSPATPASTPPAATSCAAPATAASASRSSSTPPRSPEAAGQSQVAVSGTGCGTRRGPNRRPWTRATPATTTRPPMTRRMEKGSPRTMTPAATATSGTR